MKEVKVTTRKKQKFSFMVDDEDFEMVSNERWHLVRGYPFCFMIINDAKKRVPIHRYVLGDYDGVCDHIDGNPLNNQKANLRVCQQRQNCMNRSVQSGNKSGFKGVFLQRNPGKTTKYRAQISVKNKPKHLGYFDSPIDAARAYDNAARQYYGEFAKVNL